MEIEDAINKLIETASNEVGYIEKDAPYTLYSKDLNIGENNYTKYNYEMHKIDPQIMDYPAAWCDAFVDWCFVKTFGIDNARAMLNGFDDYTKYSFQKYLDIESWYTTPKIGDQIFFKNEKGICHTGIVYKVSPETVYTIEGNTHLYSKDTSNGGEVCKKSYRINDPKIAGYGRPKYEVLNKEYNNGQ